MYKILYVIPVIVILVYFGAVYTLVPFGNDSSTTEIKDVQKLTGTPADNYEPHERDQHCGSSDAKTSQYIKEFKIPTPCTQPLSIIADYDGKIWFTQTNTGNIAKFDPESEEFTEYPNDMWSLNSASMMWGIALTEDNEIWYTDDKYGALWQFSIPDEKYSKFEIKGKTGKPSPQKIGLYNDNFVINDFSGKQIVVLNHEKLDNGIYTNATLSIPDGFFTSQAVVDNDGNMWFIMWKYQKEAILVKTNSNTQEVERFNLPDSIKAPNGVALGHLGNIWIADTAGNSFYKFNPDDNKVIEFVTSKPSVMTYGNASGLIKTPITRPYWNAFDSEGNMWFNQQTANRLAVFNPDIESLVEYDIPSRNPDWSDCGDLSDCGLSQSFGFTFKDKQVWFTEWVENNIGVLDTSVPLPIEVSIDDDEIEIKQGEQKEFFVTITPNSNKNSEVKLFGNSNSESITVNPKSEMVLISDESVKIPVTITASDDAHEGYYKILIGTQFSDVAISSYATIKVG
ncbi:virginiamycin B lyase family protein [Nitrosopumilus sp.]|uniref:virginiamycin B lyase family protein n=1 Tax=Nitrosopumilus sp. TaxID=2024843 RepID=UPI003D13529E